MTVAPISLSVTLMSGDGDISRGLRDAIARAALPISTITCTPGDEAPLNLRRATDDHVNLSIAVALQPLDADLLTAVQWLTATPKCWKMLVVQPAGPGDDSSQFPPLMTRILGAVGMHPIMCCIASKDEMHAVVIGRISHMVRVMRPV
jgi:hypothetical protein